MPDRSTIEIVKQMIESAGLQLQGAYRPGEVQKIIGISKKTFLRMTNEFERHPTTGKAVKPGTLDSFMTLGQRRVRFTDLVDFIERNQTYERMNNLV